MEHRIGLCRAVQLVLFYGMFFGCSASGNWQVLWVSETYLVLNACHSWLIKTAREGPLDLLGFIVNASLREGEDPKSLKDDNRKVSLKKPTLGSMELSNYRRVLSIPLWGKSFQGFLKEIDYLNPL